LKDIKIDDLTLRLLTAGITVCHGNDLGVDDDDQKNFRDIALWIARNLFPTPGTGAQSRRLGHQWAMQVADL
jgi:hypothetical protein